MEYLRWAPTYGRIAAEFGFPIAAEEAAARELVGLLPRRGRERPLERIAERLRGREVVVVGLAPGLGSPPLARLPPAAERPVIVAADGAADRCLRAGLVPELIVTDLDGPVPAEVNANARGSLVVVHAHGDNVEALRRWVPEFPGELAGSWAGPPREELFDVGGFTDGDRALYLVEAVGARRAFLYGFDFDRVDVPGSAEGRRKREKLAWAKRLIESLAAESPMPILWWRSDGRYEPVVPEAGAVSTQ